jgi:hypothetical protein
MNVFVQLYLFVRTAMLITTLKYGIRKHASAAWACPVAYDQVCAVVESFRLPAHKEQEVMCYLWQEMRKHSA